MFISPAYAQAGGAGGGDFLIQLLPLVLIFVVFWFFLIRPQQKKMKDHREMVAAIDRGDQVVMTGGIHGKVTGVSDDVLTVEIAERVKVKVDRAAVSRRTPSAAKEAPKGQGRKAAEAKS